MKTYIKLSILLVLMLLLGLMLSNFRLKKNYETGQFGLNQKYTLASFKHIIIKGGTVGNLTIKNAEKPTLTSNFDVSKVGINYHVANQTLYLDLPSYNEYLQVTIMLPSLKSIEVNNSNVRLENLNTDSLIIKQLGNSNLDWTFGLTNLKKVSVTASGFSSFHIGDSDATHHIGILSLNLSDHARLYTDKITTDSLALSLKDEATISVGKEILKKINEVKNY